MDDQEQMESPQEEQQEQSSFNSTKLGKLASEINIATTLTKEELMKIGRDCAEGFELDLDSRVEWADNVDKWTNLAKQTVEQKSFPWPKASNVKYPLLSTASMQFAARAYPSLIPSDGRVVKARIVGPDLDGTKTKIADAVSIYMSYQLMEEMKGWEEGMDKLLIMLPIVGTIFKKTYWDPVKEYNCSEIVMPKDLVVDYWTKELCYAERISQILEYNPRQVKERQRAGTWLKDVDLGSFTVEETVENRDSKNAPPRSDDTTPGQFIEQHTFIDLDKDEYPEPYIVTFHRKTGKVVRIAANYDEDTVKFDAKGKKVLKADPVQYFTKYGFIPNPDGSFYDIGFGVLLGPLNESANTLINQLVDAGTLANLQGGFLGKGLRLRMGDTRFTPGEWKVVNSTGDDLKKQIVPMPAKDPSKTLLDLLQLLITSGKELASVAEIFTGKMPGQNTPATTTMASIEQGMKVFTAVYKRIYRSMQEEFEKLYRLNSLYLNPGDGVDIVNTDVSQLFNSEDHRIIPGADPTAVSQTEKLMKAQGLMEMLGAGMPLDPVKVMVRMLEAQEQPNWQELIPQQILQTGQMPPPPPDPKVQALQMKAQADQAASQQKMEITQHQAELDARGKEFEMQTKAQEAQIKAVAMKQQAELKLQSQLATDHAKIATAQMQHQQSMQQQSQAHALDMQHAHEQNAAKVQQMKQQQAAKPKPTSKGTTKK